MNEFHQQQVFSTFFPVLKQLKIILQRDQQGLKLLAANDSKIFPNYENFLCVSVGTRCKL
jgi:hypothetical protein